MNLPTYSKSDLTRRPESNTAGWWQSSTKNTQSTLSAYQSYTPYPIDIGVTFYQNLSREIKGQGLAEEYQVPTTPAGETNPEALTRLHKIKDKALRFESTIQQVVNVTWHSKQGPHAIVRTFRSAEPWAVPDFAYDIRNEALDDYCYHGGDVDQWNTIPAFAARPTEPVLPRYQLPSDLEIGP